MIQEGVLNEVREIIRMSDIFTNPQSYKHNIDNFVHIRKWVGIILEEWSKIKDNNEILQEFIQAQEEVKRQWFASEVKWKDVTSTLIWLLKNESLKKIVESLEWDIFLHLNSATSMWLTRSRICQGYFTNPLEAYTHLLETIRSGKKIETTDYDRITFVGGSIVFELEGIYNLANNKNFISNGIAYDFLRYLHGHSVDYRKMGDASADYQVFKNTFNEEITSFKPYIQIDTSEFDFLTYEEKEVLKENLIADRIAFVVIHSLGKIKAINTPPKKEILNTTTTPTINSTMIFSHPLNQILYWPPGTGKTYHTVNYALSIIEWKSVEEIGKEERSEVLRRFNEYKQNGQVVFTTFHQSFWYEDFIEWLKAKSENGEIKYEVVPGIFRKVCETAKNNYSISETQDVDSITEELLKRYSEYLDEIQETETTGIGIQYQDYKGNPTLWPQLFPWEKWNTKESWIIAHASKEWESVKSFHISNGNTYQILGTKVILRDYPDFIAWKIHSKDDVRPSRSSKSLANGNADYFFALYQRLKEFDDENNITKWLKNEEKKNYILIIDEINRGNISKIFGELITLLESSKRFGNKESLSVKLPYSGDLFSVPNNLYILWTMNTTDRSIALMDIALRRRFNFVEMSPDLASLSDVFVEDINIVKMLAAINSRIEFLYDKDHLLGQAFFLPLKEESTLEKLNEIFARNIIPLLQEYFYEDGEKIQLILWDHDDQAWKDWSEKIIQESTSKKENILWIKNEDYEDKKVYALNPNLTLNSYRKIYE